MVRLAAIGKLNPNSVHGVAKAAKVLAACLWALVSGAASGDEQVAQLQAQLLKQIAADAWETRHYTGRSALSQPVLDAMAAVPRHEFVDRYGVSAAYANRPLPIGHGQTISQPFIVALMTDLLNPEEDHAVLEIGTGSGYQAAVLAALVSHVYSIEIIPELAAGAERRFEQLGISNISVKVGDGYFGWPEAGPFDGLMVTAVGPDIPPALLRQLKVGGRMVLPLGSQYGAQNLTVVTRLEEGHKAEEVLPVAFVPLTGDH